MNICGVVDLFIFSLFILQGCVSDTDDDYFIKLEDDGYDESPTLDRADYDHDITEKWPDHFKGDVKHNYETEQKDELFFPLYRPDPEDNWIGTEDEEEPYSSIEPHPVDDWDLQPNYFHHDKITNLNPFPKTDDDLAISHEENIPDLVFEKVERETLNGEKLSPNLPTHGKYDGNPSQITLQETIKERKERKKRSAGLRSRGGGNWGRRRRRYKNPGNNSTNRHNRMRP